MNNDVCINVICQKTAETLNYHIIFYKVIVLGGITVLGTYIYIYIIYYTHSPTV